MAVLEFHFPKGKLRDILGGPVSGTRRERVATGEITPQRATIPDVLAPDAFALVRLDEGGAARYAPYDRLTVANNSDEPLLVVLNGVPSGGGYRFRVLARESRAVEYAFSFFSVQNVHTANSTAADEIEYIAEYQERGADHVARQAIRGAS